MRTRVYAHLSLQRPEDNVRSSVALCFILLRQGFPLTLELAVLAVQKASKPQRAVSKSPSSTEVTGAHAATPDFIRCWRVQTQVLTSVQKTLPTETHSWSFMHFLIAFDVLFISKQADFFPPISLIRYSSCQGNNLRSMRCTGFVCNLWINLELCRP